MTKTIIESMSQRLEEKEITMVLALTIGSATKKLKAGTDTHQAVPLESFYSQIAAVYIIEEEEEELRSAAKQQESK